MRVRAARDSATRSRGFFYPLETAQRLMGIAHEVVEMDAQFVLKRQLVKEQVHQPGFTPANPAPQVQTGGGVDFPLRGAF